MKRLKTLALLGFCIIGLTACGGNKQEDVPQAGEGRDLKLNFEDEDPEYDDEEPEIPGETEEGLWNEEYEEETGGSDDSEYIPDEDYSEYVGDQEAEDQGQIDDNASDAFHGTWLTDYDPEGFYSFDSESMTWQMWNDRTEFRASGNYELSDGNAVLYDEDGEIFNYMTGYSEDMIVDQDGGTISRFNPDNDTRIRYDSPYAGSTYQFDYEKQGNDPLSDIIGEWVYRGYYYTPQRDESVYGFNEDGTWYHLNDWGETVDEGTYEIDPLGDYYSTELYLTSAYDGTEYTFDILIDSDLFIRDEDHYNLFRKDIR